MDRDRIRDVITRLEAAAQEIRQAREIVNDPMTQLADASLSEAEAASIAAVISQHLDEIRGLVVGEFEPWAAVQAYETTIEVSREEAVLGASIEEALLDAAATEAVIGENVPWPTDDESGPSADEDIIGEHDPWDRTS